MRFSNKGTSKHFTIYNDSLDKVMEIEKITISDAMCEMSVILITKKYKGFKCAECKDELRVGNYGALFTNPDPGIIYCANCITADKALNKWERMMEEHRDMRLFLMSKREKPYRQIKIPNLRTMRKECYGKETTKTHKSNS